LLAELRRPYVYAALRAGITGTSTVIDEDTLAFLTTLGGSTSQESTKSTRILGGFGIRSGIQARAIESRVYAVVAGSVFVDCIRQNAGGGELAVENAVTVVARDLSAT